MIRLIYFFIFIIFFSSKLFAENVSKIEISGNKRVSDETIIIYGDIKLNKDYQENDLNVILKNLYSTNFFEDIKINLENNILYVNLKEYPVISQLILIGEDSKRIRDQIKKIISSKEKRSFIKSKISKDVELIRKLYSSIGYNNSKIETKIKKLDDNNLDLIIELAKGSITKISSIKFIGDKKIRDKRLRDVIASEEDNFWKVISSNTKFSQNLVDLDIRLLTNYYKSRGYYNVKINSSSGEINEDGNIDLVYSIDAGDRFTINKISTNVDSVFDEEIFFPLKKNYNKYIGQYYSPFTITKLLENIDELILNNNLQFVEHTVEEKLNKNTIEIKFNIFESEKVLVERINISGNNITNESVIRGELLLDEGDPFTDLNLKKSISKIKSRRIFADVKSKIIDGSKKNLKIIDIEVEEQPTGEISAGAGIGTNGGQFALNVSENNWLGKGQRLDFAISVSEESLSGRINFTDPNYNFFGNSLNYYASNTKNDKPNQGYENTIISSGINTTFEQYKDLYATLGISFTYDDLRTKDNASASLKKQSGEFSDITGSYGFKYDTRNQTFMPTSGSIIDFGQSIPLYADKSFISNTFSVSNYKLFTENIVGSSKLFLTAVNGLKDDDVRLSKRKNLSSKRLRGFERGKIGPVDGKDHIGGNYAAALNLEANLPNLLPENSKTEVGLFLDFGNVWGVDYDSSINDGSKLRSSTGAAINWLSPLGPMSFIFATNLNKSDTDVTESFNFNLGTTF